ncbi:glycoside hydrolase family 97 catalytic domain-containing protein [Flavivirga abyssicola]|uniref:glycoside hydrolase family 97 protein n=1 Tax=Flavivirga abyssicola TaxID=3063533 RepID=UPI0026DF5185|nr:glycoside hydrolase family 97 protein [Flavivirga sp. MEBiC07777]WVK13783.1 glycoside hydrolase family 97 catalytic domain-containing protein [Flavivirga sp. MEBiC07777]
MVRKFKNLTSKHCILSFLWSVIFGVTFISCDKAPKDQFELTGGTNTAYIFKFQDNQLGYKIVSKENVVIDSSAFGIIVGGKELGSNTQIKQLETSNIKQEFPLLGVKNKGRYEAHQTTFELTENDGVKWYLDVQVSNQGVAYRYRVPGKTVQVVNGESTSYKFPNKTKVWYFERNNNWKLKSHAGEWFAADISEMPKVSKMGPVQGLTLTLELPQGGYALLAEAALYNYSGTRLEAIGNNTFKSNFTEGKNGFKVDGNITSPWRCVLLADDLNALVNNVMVPALNPEPDPKLFADKSWIKPGTAVWHWWSKKFANYQAERDMIDDAKALGFEYSMVDEGWERWENKWEATTKLCEDATSKGVGVFLWKHSKELNFPENDYEVMRLFLDSIAATGAKGIKVDFMNGQTKGLIDFDEHLLKKSAERKLMVNFHGCQQSSGEYRTYPNEVTREGIRGLEINGIKNERNLTASHNAALPFTRYITGHADYTPIGFTNPGETTWAHQLATLVCFYSPFNCIAENTDYLLTAKEVKTALPLLDEMPSVWDESIVLPQSKIGEMAIIARRSGKDWYLGVLSSGATKQITIDCNFLEDKDYTAEIFKDDLESDKFDVTGLHPRQFEPEHNLVTMYSKEASKANKNTKLNIDLAKNGGAVICFKAQ